MLLSLRIIPMSLLALFIFSLIWYLNVSSPSRCIPKCFWDDICWTEKLLKERDGWYALFSFREKITSCACLDGSRLKDIFHLLAKRLTLYFMGNWNKLMYTRIARYEAWLIWIKQFVCHQALKNCIKNDFFKKFSTNT